ncbi:hypothetical protein [Rhizobium esperanzae]|uniref:Uncharacterized protein n=1 Tax=Rhizobium esperanzae TaxID=1967781 RepID=A0A7W6W413_9HYPH|nr:hypothetical protein [Rhizobium esperanzae]MBB4235092.1 hypothetical protein [Rhizobium esperanzae]
MEKFSFAEIKGMTADGPGLASPYKRANSSGEIDAALRRLMVFAAQTPGYPIELLSAHFSAAATARKLLLEIERGHGSAEAHPERAIYWEHRFRHS